MGVGRAGKETRPSHQREYDEFKRKARRSDIVPPSVTKITEGMASTCSSRCPVRCRIPKMAAANVRNVHGLSTIVVAPTLREETVLDHVSVR